MTTLDAVKAQQQKTWSLGDFAVIGLNTVFPGELMCEAVQLRAGEKVIDVAAGTGNVAISAARRGCDAVATDYVPALVERGRERAAAERLSARFEVGDCENIEFPDSSFDVVISVFGSIFAPNQEKAASELVRVCRSGGRIGMANWTPEGFWGQTFGLIARYLPPPPGVRPPPEWGTQKRLRELFDAHIASLQIEKRTALFRFRSSAHWIEVFSAHFGPIMRVLSTLEGEKREAFLKDLDATLNRFNVSGDDTLVVGADYLEVVMVKK